MRTKFLLGLAPLLAVLAFAMTATAAQASPACFKNKEKGECIKVSDGLVASLSSSTADLTDTVNGADFTTTGAFLEGKAELKGKSKITKSSWSGTTTNIGCEAVVKQEGSWTDQLAETPTGLTDTITVPAGTMSITLSGIGCLFPVTWEIHGTLTGSWTNPPSESTPATLTFTNAKGLVMGAEENPTTFTGTFAITRANGSNIFASKE